MDFYKHFSRIFLLILFTTLIESLPTTSGEKSAADNWNWALSDRTWRWNKKALAPVLIGLAAKALTLIPLVLTGLTIMGSVAMFTGKLSLFLSAFMFLKRFFSNDRSTGGFFGLNPFGFPHLKHTPQFHKGTGLLHGLPHNQ